MHSCKAYSDYLFIIYDCIEAKSTVNICDDLISTQFELNDKSNIHDSLMYIQSPNYPNEYLNNLDCNCSIRTNKDASMQIELMEFDLESTDNLIETKSTSSSVSSNNYINTAIDFRLNKEQSSLNSCSKDFFSINSNTQLCGTQTQFSSLLNLQHHKNNIILNSNQITNLRLFSDDALTRRGFWIKLKVSKLNKKCPENYILIDNKCFKVMNQQLTWYEAHSYCNSMGHSLLSIDNFEFEKKLNKILYENEDTLKYVFNSNNFTKFWIGVKHLNKTNWFDSNNNLIQFRDDEKNWWPWLIVDSKTYNQGSCVGKKRNFLFLEDCYKRMPFACQIKNDPEFNFFSKNNNPTKIEFKCGKKANDFFVIEKSTTTTTTQSTTTKRFISVNKFNRTSKMISTQLVKNEQDNIIDLNDVNKLPFSIKSNSIITKEATSVRPHGTDSSMFNLKLSLIIIFKY